MEDVVLDTYFETDDKGFEVYSNNNSTSVPAIDYSAAKSSDNKRLTVSIINRDPESTHEVSIIYDSAAGYSLADVHVLKGSGKDDYNDIDRAESVKVEKGTLKAANGTIVYGAPAHSVSIIELSI
jgi:alpha-L-arabinofuranosidase